MISHRFCAHCDRQIDTGLAPGNSGGGQARWTCSPAGDLQGPYCPACSQDLCAGCGTPVTASDRAHAPINRIGGRTYMGPICHDRDECRSLAQQKARDGMETAALRCEVVAWVGHHITTQLNKKDLYRPLVYLTADYSEGD